MLKYIDQYTFNFYKVQTLRREEEGGWDEGACELLSKAGSQGGWAGSGVGGNGLGQAPMDSSHFLMVGTSTCFYLPGQGSFLFCNFYKCITNYSQKCSVWTTHSVICLEVKKGPPAGHTSWGHTEGPSRNVSFQN